MFKKMIISLALSISCLIGEEIFNLKDGSSIKGERISSDEKIVIVKTLYGEISINKEDLIIKNYKIELTSGEVFIGNKVEGNNGFIILETDALGKINIDKNNISSIQEINESNSKSSSSKTEQKYYTPRNRGLLSIFDSDPYPDDKDADFTIGEEELIDLFIDPTGHTLKDRTLYLSGLSFGVGISDRFQITTNCGSFFWGNLNLSPKFKLCEKGNWERQHSLSIGAHLHNRWWTTQKVEWQSGNMSYNKFSVEQYDHDDDPSTNYKWKQTAPMETVDKYWGGFEAIGATTGYSQTCDFPDTGEYDPNAVYTEGNDELGIFDDDPRSYCNSIDHEEDWPYQYMTEFFGAYTFSKARENLKGRISHTIGGNVQIVFVDNGTSFDPKFLYRAYYGLDVDVTSKLKIISEIFYDPYYIELWRLMEMDDNNDDGDYDYHWYDGELQNLSDEVVAKDNIIPVFLDFGIVYAFNNNLRVAVHFQRPFIGFYWKF